MSSGYALSASKAVFDQNRQFSYFSPVMIDNGKKERNRNRKKPHETQNPWSPCTTCLPCRGPIPDPYIYGGVQKKPIIHYFDWMALSARITASQALRSKTPWT